MHRPPMVIIEGPDGAGKTALVTDLQHGAQRSGCVVKKHHCGVPIEHPLVEYLDVLTKLYRDQMPVVIDRFHIGEQVYGPIVRGEDELGERGRVAFEYVIRSYFIPLLVVAVPPLGIARQNWAERKGLEYVKEDATYNRIWTTYSEGVKTSLPVIFYDYTNDDASDIRVRLVKHLVTQ